MRGEVLINEKGKQGLLERKQRLGTATLKELLNFIYDLAVKFGYKCTREYNEFLQSLR